MKKVTAALLLSIALVSCKKETKTITKTDPKTGKTITVEVPAEEEKTVPLAVKDSAGIYKVNFVLEKGKTYPFTSYQRDIQTLSNGQQTINGTNESTDEMNFTVENIDADGNYILKMQVKGKRMSTSSQGKIVTVDTRESAPGDAQQKFMWTVQKAQTQSPLSLKMSPAGKIISITGFEETYKKVEAAAAPIIKDKAQTTSFMDGFKQGFNEKFLKEQFGKNINILPIKGVKIGQSWTNTENVTPNGSVKISTTYTLKKVEDGIAEISIKGGIPRKANNQSKDGLTHSISLEGSQTGTIILDASTGWILGSKLQLKTIEKESLTDGKQSQTMSKKTNSLVTINPSYKF